MRTRISSARSLVAAALLSLFGTAVAHSWPEETRRIAPNGTMIGESGFDRHHIPRGAIQEDLIRYLVPPIGASIITSQYKVVRDNQLPLNDQSYNDKFPMLKVAPGDFVAIKYTENGHVTKQDLPGANFKPVNRGTVYLYGTTTANDLTNYALQDIHLQWTADGTGGDGKGKLLATRNFDDGQCHEVEGAGGDAELILGYRKAALGASGEEVNNGLSCQSDLQIPLDVSPGETLTIIWVWDWPTMSAGGYPVSPATYHANSSDFGEVFVTMPEIYTGVVDYKIVDPCDPSLGEIKGPTCGAKKGNGKAVVNFARQRRPTLAGIRSQMLKPFLIDVPQANKGATIATAEPSDIPVFGLIGVKGPPPLPLHTSLFLGLDGFTGPSPTEAPQPGPEAPKPTSEPKPTTTAVTTAAPSPTTRPSFPGFNDKILTVTVTVPATTVYLTETETATATGGVPAGTGNLALSPTGRPSVSPFLRHRMIRREPGAWRF
ncbi:hypothetical protein B0T14DRAFT_420343 [Immersiella caudata]|uniref:DUF7492 domain-containing protein n=1 Tax=Immersiella caudata TaxID=314043 RepID=A0AA39XD77_9PEZI|nr:hypothetical protein B0T14DRAFT_420343 [Immersiella caudata]